MDEGGRPPVGRDLALLGEAAQQPFEAPVELGGGSRQPVLRGEQRGGEDVRLDRLGRRRFDLHAHRRTMLSDALRSLPHG